MTAPDQSPFPAPTPFSLARLGRLIRKELRESLRDRRTSLTLILMPLFLYPLLGLIFLIFFRTPVPTTNQSPTFRIAMLRTEHELIRRYLGPGELVLQKEQGFERDTEEEKPGPREPYLQFMPDVELKIKENLEEAVENGQADVALRLKQSANKQAGDAKQKNLAEWELLYLEGSPQSIAAVRYLLRLISASNEIEMLRRLHNLGEINQLPPVIVQVQKQLAPPAKRSSELAALLPLVLVLMTMTGAVYPAIDLTAGERERGTLEILMAAPTPRLSLLLAKYVAVLTVALLTALINLGMMFATLLFLGLWQVLYRSGGLPGVVLFQVLGLLVLFAAFFSAVLLTITSVARSFKEAQAYLIPLMIVALMPAVLSLLPGLHLSGIICLVPLLNIVLLARDLLDGNAHLVPSLLVVLITLVYAFVALALAAVIFGRSALD